MSNEREIEFLKMEVERLGGRVLDLESNLEGFEQGIMSQDADEPVRRIISGSGISIHRSGETVSVTADGGVEELEVNSDDPEGDTVIIELGDETIYTSASTWPKPYDLYDVSYAATPSITFKVRGAKWNDGTAIGIPFFGSSNYWVGLAGQWTAVANGSVSFDTETTFTANDLIYLKIVRGTSAAQTLEKNSSSAFANATDSASQAVIHIPLWGFEVDGNEMRVIDLRDVPRIDMMGN